MEVKATHAVFNLDQDADVGALRRYVVRLADEAGLEATLAAEAGLVATELGTNVLKHAQHGGALVARSAHGLELVVWDRGPGMHLASSLPDGVSTAGTRGVGLGAVTRLASSWSAHSAPGAGSVILARFGRSEVQRVEVEGVNVPYPGLEVSGDRWAVHHDGPVCTLLVADGLGHGEGAEEAAAAVCAAFALDPASSLVSIMERADRAARGTRGAAATVVRLDCSSRTFTVCGVGNVTPWLVGTARQQLVVQHGTLGQRIPRLREELIAWPPGSHLVLASDGLKGQWDSEPSLWQCAPAVIAATLWRDHDRGRDDTTVVVARRAS